MEYLHALQDPRVQYAVATGEIDDKNIEEVTTFLENIMRNTAPQLPKCDYIVVRNMYAHFARKIEHGQEADQETDLEKVLNMVDHGWLIECGRDTTRSATFYTPGEATRQEMQKLAAETQRRLEHAIAEYERRLRAHQGTGEMRESVYGLTRRVRTQQATLAYLEKK